MYVNCFDHFRSQIYRTLLHSFHHGSVRFIFKKLYEKCRRQVGLGHYAARVRSLCRSGKAIFIPRTPEKKIILKKMREFKIVFLNFHILIIKSNFSYVICILDIKIGTETSLSLDIKTIPALASGRLEPITRARRYWLNYRGSIIRTYKRYHKLARKII